jgi:serine protease AprX
MTPLRIIFAFLTLFSLVFGSLRDSSQGSIGSSGSLTLIIPEPDNFYKIASGLHPDLILDYGTFLWISLPSAELVQLKSAGIQFYTQSNPYSLRLGEISFDPLITTPKLPSGWDQTEISQPDLHLIQFVGPTKDTWLKTLEIQGIEIVQYIHPYTYVVWSDNSALKAISDESFVRWSNSFSPAFRVLPAWRDLNSELILSRAMIYKKANTIEIIKQIEINGGKIVGQSTTDPTFDIIQFEIAGSNYKTLANIPGLYSLQPVSQNGGLRSESSSQINAGNYDSTNLASPGYLEWLISIGISGNKVIIANVDAGIDEEHLDLQTRMLLCSGLTCGNSTKSDHGTQTAGIMVGDGSSGIMDSEGFLRGLGVAPQAKLIEQVYDPFYKQAGGLSFLMFESYSNGATLSGNSWGTSDTPVGYDENTRQIDIGVRDAQYNLYGNQPLIYVQSIMNGYGGEKTQGAPDEAKNIITVGSTKLLDATGEQILDINDISENSAHGPALDGRKIPHLVAPGCQVDSTKQDNTYGLECSTSFASPQVTGAVALFVQYYRARNYDANPSPALAKAAFLPVAFDLAGNLDADGNLLGHPFDSKQGWGRLNLAAVIDPEMNVLYFDNPLILDETGEEWVQQLYIADTSKPFRIMLVWTDAPGHGLGGDTPAWNNNLDLKVEYNNLDYWGNNFNTNGWSQIGGTPDYQNNTEGVFLQPAGFLPFTIRVIGANIPSDGIPNQGDSTDQDFALVCYNCTDNPNQLIRKVFLPVINQE